MLTNTTLLRKKIDESGYKLGYIAEKLGISRQGLYKKLDNKAEFRASEIQTLYTMLKLTKAERDRIFFAGAASKTDA